MTSPSPRTVLPLFPLGTVLYPGGLLPLRIFEVRYLDMITRCHHAGTPFGVVALTQGSEVRVAGAQAEQFATIGTLASIRHLGALQGRAPGASAAPEGASEAAPWTGAGAVLQIECRGTQRFRVHNATQHKNGLWSAEAELLPDDVTLPIPPDLQHTRETLERLVHTLEERQRQQAAATGQTPALPVAAPYQFDDCGWVANRWCELMPLPAELKQRLMELTSPLMRLELVSDLLARTGIAKG